MYRLRQLQVEGVRFEWTSLPIEVVNRRGTPKDILDLVQAESGKVRLSAFEEFADVVLTANYYERSAER